MVDRIKAEKFKLGIIIKGAFNYNLEPMKNSDL
jgi:hypothetical protein